MVTISMLTSLFFASSITAELVVDRISQEPMGRLSFSKRFNFGPSVENDRRRINSPQSIVATNKIFSYVVEVSVGSNTSKKYSLFIDSATPITWVGGNIDNPYSMTNTSKKLGSAVAINFNLLNSSFGGLPGEQYSDQITLSPDLVIPSQTIAVGDPIGGFSTLNIDGGLGIGLTVPVEATPDISEPGGNETIKTTIQSVTDSLFEAGTIPRSLIAVSFEPPFGSDPQNGELTWGGTDPTKFIGDIIFFPSPLGPLSFWNIDASLSYGSTTFLKNTNFVIDSSAYFFSIPTEAFGIYQNATSAVLSPGGLLTIHANQSHLLQSIFITVSGSQLELVPDAQIWPQQFNHLLDSEVDSNDLILIVQDAPSDVLPLIGMGVLERFYVVFDSTNFQVGFANTAFTNASAINFNNGSV